MFYCMALVNYFKLAQMLSAGGYAASQTSGQLEQNVTHLVNGFKNTWDLGYIFFGVHLLLLGIFGFVYKNAQE